MFSKQKHYGVAPKTKKIQEISKFGKAPVEKLWVMRGVRAVVRDASGKKVKKKDGTIEKPDGQLTLSEFAARPKSPAPNGSASVPPGASHASPAASAASGSEPPSTSPPVSVSNTYQPQLVPAAASEPDTAEEREGKCGSEPCAPIVLPPHGLCCAELVATLRLELIAAQRESVRDIDAPDISDEYQLYLFRLECNLLYSWLVRGGGCREESAAAEAMERYGNLVADMEEDFFDACERLDAAARADADGYVEAALARMALAETTVRLHSLASPSHTHTLHTHTHIHTHTHPHTRIYGMATAHPSVRVQGGAPVANRILSVQEVRNYDTSSSEDDEAAAPALVPSVQASSGSKRVAADMAPANAPRRRNRIRMLLRWRS